jgi:hypothetical protein
MSGSFVHNSIIAGCRCLAGHLPSSPTKRDTMPLGDHLAPSSTSRHLITICLTASLAAALLAVISITGEDDKHALTTPESIESSSSAAVRSTTTPRQLVSRLREILRIREAAYRSRNPDLLRSVYSSDCPCLASDEKAIYELLRRAYMWDGIETSVEIRRVTKLHERLWTVTALFRSETLRIETEDGKLVRKEPAGSDLFEFTLVKPRYAHRWLLGRASVVEG